MEVESAVNPGDWTRKDREEGTEAWHRAQLHLMCLAAAGSPATARWIAQTHYATIVERAAFYNWFDQIRLLQGHEVVWPGTAWLVAGQFARFDKIGNATSVMSFTLPAKVTVLGHSVTVSDGATWTLYRRGLGEAFASVGSYLREGVEGTLDEPGWDRVLAAGSTLDDLVAFANAGNKRIFEDVYSTHLPDVFRKGLSGQRIVGTAAEAWDSAMVETEQRVIVEPVYIEHVAHKNPRLGTVLNELMACEAFVSGADFINPVKWDRQLQGQVAMCQSGLDVTKAEDRVAYGKNVVVKFYREAASDGRLKKMRPPQKYVPVGPIRCGG